MLCYFIFSVLSYLSYLSLFILSYLVLSYLIFILCNLNFNPNLNLNLNLAKLGRNSIDHNVTTFDKCTISGKTKWKSKSKQTWEWQMKMKLTWLLELLLLLLLLLLSLLVPLSHEIELTILEIRIVVQTNMQTGNFIVQNRTGPKVNASRKLQNKMIMMMLHAGAELTL